ncbi:uncharacterized protein B0P05DRAFT_240687 [Gilbertella persicaria]|uniref:uncharacterized protein n=1 Tax=Gilbertella persicaria TaxID=101096 RepID=UPI002220F3AD|nr:uncharacterized protein B0P05DRAFT_240687 [Gilbertella persicaria]KAI8063439.1 hypothetical protein B0P05DRAFT_240687 [Gilbertella persicaria]
MSLVLIAKLTLEYQSSTLVPVQTITVVSISAALANKLQNEDIRDLFDYKTDFDQNALDNQGIYKDVFSGSVYQQHRCNNIIQYSSIVINLYFDDFVSKSQQKPLQMIIATIPNIDPMHRYMLETQSLWD